MGYMKGKSSMMIFESHANLKYKFGSRHFSFAGCYVNTLGLNTATIQKYIRDRRHDISERLTAEEFTGPMVAGNQSTRLERKKGSSVQELAALSPLGVVGDYSRIDNSFLKCSELI